MAWRRLLFGLGVVLASALAFLGIFGAINEAGQASTRAQGIQTVLQALYGTSSLAVIAAAIRRHRLLLPLVVASCLACAGAAALAPGAWGRSWGIGTALEAGAAGGLIALLSGMALMVRGLTA